MKKNIGILFGGISVEHEVSIITGLQIYENIDKEKYDVTIIYVDKEGRWYTGEGLKDVHIYQEFDKNISRLTKGFGAKIKAFYPSLDKSDKKNVLNGLDCICLACHGNYGEDGKLQGMLEIMDIPYTSCGIISSSTGMDKIVMKKILSGMGLPTLTYLWFSRDEWAKDKQEWINKIKYTLDYPIIVKPANLGSSIGISMATNEEELIDAVEVAIRYDKRILVEKGIENPVEVNSSAMKRDGEILISELEEPVRWEKFLSFSDKYLHNSGKTGGSKTAGGQKGGMSNMGRKIPAEISAELAQQIREFSKKIYRAVDCKGVIRIDYILDSERTNVYVNEVNTIPGSWAFYLWEAVGIKFSEVIDISIREAIKDHDDRKHNIYKYDSDILKNVGGGSKR